MTGTDGISGSEEQTTPLPLHVGALCLSSPRHTYPTNCITRGNDKPFNLFVEAAAQLSTRRCGAVEVILLVKSHASMWLPTTSSGLTISNQQLLQSPRRPSTGQNNNTPFFSFPEIPFNISMVVGILCMCTSWFEKDGLHCCESLWTAFS